MEDSYLSINDYLLVYTQKLNSVQQPHLQECKGNACFERTAKHSWSSSMISGAGEEITMSRAENNMVCKSQFLSPNSIGSEENVP